MKKNGIQPTDIEETPLNTHSRTQNTRAKKYKKNTKKYKKKYKKIQKKIKTDFLFQKGLEHIGHCVVEE